MKIHSYYTTGGKDLIIEYLNSLPKSEKAEKFELETARKRAREI